MTAVRQAVASVRLRPFMVWINVLVRTGVTLGMLTVAGRVKVTSHP